MRKPAWRTVFGRLHWPRRDAKRVHISDETLAEEHSQERQQDRAIDRAVKRPGNLPW